MGLFAASSSLVMPARLRASGQAYQRAFWGGEALPSEWSARLSAAGVPASPELAMTLSAFHGGVKTICLDLATLPLQTFAERDDGGKDFIRPYFGGGIDTSNGIRSLAYMMRWQPNYTQTAAEFQLGMFAQWLLRGVACAEIVSGPSGFMEQLLPRHPDRIRTERLPSGRLRYRLNEFNGPTPRYLTQDELFVVRDLSFDGGLTTVGIAEYGANAIGTILAAEHAAGKFFSSGMTAAVVATYDGTMEDEHEAALHQSISRYATGAENNFGLLLVPDDVKISNLGIDPEKAQMMAAREWGVREVARYLRIPGYKLGIKDSISYGSQVQAAVEYVVSCLRPIAVIFEQAIKRDLILSKDQYRVEFQLQELFRGDPDARAAYYERAIRNRWMRPSEVRLRENLNPDEELDRLSAADFQPGKSGATPTPGPSEPPARLPQRATVKALQAVHDNAIRCLRRERAAVSKLAQKHAADVDGWKVALREFYGDHARFVAQVMRLDPRIARGYAAQHGTVFEAHGAKDLLDEQTYQDWERFESDELSALALEQGRMAA